MKSANINDICFWGWLWCDGDANETITERLDRAKKIIQIKTIATVK